MPAGKPPLNPQLRQCFRDVLTGVPLLAGGAAPPLAACIRSPWAHYSLSGALANGGSPARDTGNEFLPSLRSLTGDPAQWDTGHWIGDGAQRGLEVAWTSDRLGLDAVASTGFGSLLIGVATFHQLAATSSETIVSIGSRRETVTGPIDNRIELSIDPDGHANVTVADDNGTLVSATVDEPGVPAAGPDALPLALFVLIDNRPNGSQTVSIHQYQLGTGNRVSRVESIAALGSVAGGPPGPEKVLTVGHSRNVSGGTVRHYNGPIRNLHMLNFGQKMPDDIDLLMDRLSGKNMLPGRFMEGL